MYSKQLQVLHDVPQRAVPYAADSFLSRKQQILYALQDAIDHADSDAMALRRQQKRGL